MKLNRILSLALSMLILLAYTGASAETAPQVQLALDHAGLLTNDLCAIIPGLGVIVREEESSDTYRSAALHNPRKIIVSSSSFDVLSISENNELYFLYDKIADNVVDCAYVTTNVDEHGLFITADGHTHYVYGNDGEPANVSTVSGDPMPINSLVTERHDFFAVTDSMVVCNGHPEDWAGCDFSGWSNVAQLDAANVFVRNPDTKELTLAAATVAGITHDGRTLATGDYADEILSWGPLSYISMQAGVIIGLSTDGTLRITGAHGAPLMNTDVPNWKNLVAVHVGWDSVVALDAAGNYYFQPYDSEMESAGKCTVVNKDGIVSGTDSFILYGADGYTYRATCNNPVFADENGNLPRAASAIQETGSALPTPLTEEAILAYVAELTADLHPRMDAERYSFSICMTDDGSMMNQLQIKVFKLESEVDQALLGEVMQRIVHSELFDFTEASHAEFDSFTFRRNTNITCDGWETQYSELPGGGMILFFTKR